MANKEEKSDEKQSSWKDFIYNPRTGEFIGRTASSWGKSSAFWQVSYCSQISVQLNRCTSWIASTSKAEGFPIHVSSRLSDCSVARSPLQCGSMCREMQNVKPWKIIDGQYPKINRDNRSSSPSKTQPVLKVFVFLVNCGILSELLFSCKRWSTAILFITSRICVINRVLIERHGRFFLGVCILHFHTRLWVYE